MIIQDQSAPPLANVDVMGLTLPPPNHHFVVNQMSSFSVVSALFLWGKSRQVFSLWRESRACDEAQASCLRASPKSVWQETLRSGLPASVMWAANHPQINGK
jgi:hypothetical protein